MVSDLMIWKRQDNLALSIEAPFARKIYREKNRFIREQAEKLTLGVSISDIDIANHAQKMDIIFREYYKRTIRIFSLEIEKGIANKSIGLFVEKKAYFWEFLYLKWINERGGEMAKETALTTAGDINKILRLANAQETGVSPKEFTRNILNTRGLSRWRAETIARTETGSASSFASVETARKMEVDSGIRMLKKWVPALDERTRSSHAHMAGVKPIPLDAKFMVNGSPMDRPKDPNGGSSNVINCRCVLAYVTEI